MTMTASNIYVLVLWTDEDRYSVIHERNVECKDGKTTAKFGSKFYPAKMIKKSDNKDEPEEHLRSITQTVAGTVDDESADHETASSKTKRGKRAAETTGNKEKKLKQTEEKEYQNNLRIEKKRAQAATFAAAKVMADRIVKPVFNPVLQFNTPSSLQQDLQPMATVQQPVQSTVHDQQPVQPTVHHQQPVQPTVHHQQPVLQPIFQQQPIIQPTVHHQQPVQPTVHHQQPVQPTVHHQQPIIQPTVHHQQPIQSTFQQQPPAVHDQQTVIMPNPTTEIQSNQTSNHRGNLFPESQNLLNCLRMANSALNEIEDSPTFGNSACINNISDVYMDHSESSHDECNARISQLEERVKFLESNLLKDFLGKLSSKVSSSNLSVSNSMNYAAPFSESGYGTATLSSPSGYLAPSPSGYSCTAQSTSGYGTLSSASTSFSSSCSSSDNNYSYEVPPQHQDATGSRSGDQPNCMPSLKPTTTDSPSHMIDLYPGCGVKISVSQLNLCRRKAKDSPTAMSRLLLLVFFDQTVLSESCARGTSKRRALDAGIVDAIVQFCLEYRKGKATEKDIIQAINNKCADVRQTTGPRKL